MKMKAGDLKMVGKCCRVSKNKYEGEIKMDDEEVIEFEFEKV